MNELQENIRQTLLNAPSGVHSIFYGIKKKNGIKTDEFSLIHFVEQKLPLSALPVDQIIPKHIILDDVNYKTDVVQVAKFQTNQCYNLNDPAITYLNTKQRPLSGGLVISDLARWTEVSANRFSSYIGTLGFIAVDNRDNTLVGVTNNHVAIKDAFDTSERNVSDEIFNIYSPLVFQSSFTNGFNGTYNQTILQYTKGQPVSFTFDSIGRPKRYATISTINTNYLDAALITINEGMVNSSSASQAELANTHAMPFATTTEINRILTSVVGSIPIYSVGRTTGPKGVNCPLEIYGSGSIYIAYNKQGSNQTITLSDVILYKFIDESNLPIYHGDSGSAVIANFNGTNKIIGLAFAGDTNAETEPIPTSTHGVLCRIDHIASILNISAWDGSNKAYTSPSQDSISTIVRPASDSRQSITYNGKTYYQAGLIETDQSVTNI
jgi:hypothetical protein